MQQSSSLRGMARAGLAPLALAAAALALGACRKPASPQAPGPTRAPGAAARTGGTSVPGTPGPGPGTPLPGGGGAGAGAANPMAALMGGAGLGEPNPRPYAAVITPRAKSAPGLVTTHLQGGKLYFEIPAKELGRDMLVVRTLRGTQAGVGIQGTLAGNRLVRFERRENRILLRGATYQNISSDTTSPINRALDIIKYTPILAAFNVEAYGKDSAAVVDVTRLFVGGVAELIQGATTRPADPSRSFIEKVSTFDRNVEIEASQTFGAAPTPAAAGGPPNPLAALLGAAPSGTELYHFSLVRLPDVPMQPRLNDARVGYFGTSQLDFGTREYRVKPVRFANRWRVECSDQREGNLCVPKRPITYYVDPATPTWLVPWIKAGVEEWQPAFADAGFARGIVAREVPRDSIGLVNGEDATVAMVRWLPSTVENAVGPSTVDPRSGEILDADVMMYHQIMNLQRSWYFTQVGHLDTRAQRWPMPDSLMGRLVQFVVAHEVGHTLGFPHNMKGSSMYAVDSVRSRTWVARMGHSPSIMDYARFNYVAQPEDGIAVQDLIPKVGPYDRFAVKWGYTPIPEARSAQQEKATLDQWARAQDSIPWLRFASDAGIQGADPGEANEAVGDQDAVRATALGMRNLERIAKLLVPAAAAEEGETYDALEETYGRLVGQWATELGHVARIPGGQYKQEKVIGQTGPVFRPVEARRQREAVAFLNQKAFTTPTFLLDPTVLRRFEAQGSVDRIGAAQRRVLTTLLDNSRLQRMVEHEGIASAGGSRDVYPLGQMLTDLRRGIWAEAYRGGAADPYRRRLQRSYLELVAAKINPPATPTLPPGLPPQLQQLLATQNAQDARALLRGDLVELDRDLARAVGRVSDRTTRLHLQDARAQIDRILHPDGEGRRAN